MAEVIRQTVETDTRITDSEDIRIVDPTPDVTCPIHIDCPDSLLLNYSSEVLNLNEYHSVFYGADGCIGRCTSTISQEDADLCAIRQAAECVLNPEEECFGNEPQSCTTSCPDGSSSYTYTVPANTFFYTTQAEANAAALAYACEQAEAERFCLSFEDVPIACCLGTEINAPLSVSNDPGGISYAITTGALPTGLSLDEGVIIGTASAAGNYAATIQASDEDGNYSALEFTMSVITITDTSLPEFFIGAAYSHQMSVAGGSGPYTWELVAGTFPTGMSMSDSGLISGTPTAGADVVLTFQVTDTTKGVSCQKQLTLEASAEPSPHLNGMIPAYSEDSEMVGCSFLGDPATDSGIISRRVPDQQTGDELLGLLPTGGANSGQAWCPVNNKFYHGTWQHDLGGGDIGMVLVYDPISDTTEIIGGFTPTSASAVAQRAIWIPTTSRMWVQCSIGLNRIFAIIDPTDNSYTFLSDAALIGIIDMTLVSGELWVTKTLSGARVFRIDVSTLVSSLVLNEAMFEAWKGGAVTGWTVGAIEYIQSVNEIWVAVGFNEGFGAESRILSLDATTGAIIGYVGGGSPLTIFPFSIYYVQPFDRVVIGLGGTLGSLWYIDPADELLVQFSTDGMSANKGCFCTNISKVGLPVLSGSTYTVNFFTAADLGA